MNSMRQYSLMGEKCSDHSVSLILLVSTAGCATPDEILSHFVIVQKQIDDVRQQG